MKKANTSNTTMTIEQVRQRKLTKAQERELKATTAIPDDWIDTSDVPEISDFSEWKRAAFYRPVTRPITIRLNAPDIAIAQQLANVKGVPYQTYIKKVLHDALERELNKGNRQRPTRSTR